MFAGRYGNGFGFEIFAQSTGGPALPVDQVLLVMACDSVFLFLCTFGILWLPARIPLNSLLPVAKLKQSP